MKRYYLYNEDMSGYISKNDLPYSDTSEYISGFLNKEFEDELYFDDKIKKAYRGQYFQNQVIYERDSNELGNSLDVKEDGYYKITMKAHDNTGTNVNDWWIHRYYTWNEVNKSGVLTFKSDNHSWSYRSGNIKSDGKYAIYDQFVVLYRQTNPVENWAIYNIVKNRIEYYNGSTWVPIPNVPLSVNNPENSGNTYIFKGLFEYDNDPSLAFPNTNWFYFNTFKGTVRLYNENNTPDKDGSKWRDQGTTPLEYKGEFRRNDEPFLELKYDTAGVIDLSFLNTEYLNDFWQFKIKCKNDEIFYDKTYYNTVLNGAINTKKNDYTSVSFEGVGPDVGNSYYAEFKIAEGTDNKGLFTRYEWPWIREYSNYPTTGNGPPGAGGYYEKYILLNTNNYSYIYPNTFYSEGGPITVNNGSATRSVSKDMHTYQYSGHLNAADMVGRLTASNGNFSDGTNNRGLKTTLQSVGVTTDIFGMHKYISPISGYLKIEFLGPKTLSTITSTVDTLPSGVSLLQDPVIKIPRNNRIKYDFLYSEDKIQINRGKALDEEKEIHIFISGDGPNQVSGYRYEKQDEIDSSGLSGIVPGKTGIYTYYSTYINKADTSCSYVEKRIKGKLTGIIPLSDIVHFTRNSDYSESFEFTLKYEDYKFFFKREKKKYRVYYDPKYLIKNDDGTMDNSIVSIKVNGNDITSDKLEEKYFEVGDTPNDPGENYWATIEVVYNKANWGLVRDITAVSSTLIELLNYTEKVNGQIKNATWTYGGKTDKIYVKMNRDIYLDLSHQNILYMLYVAFIKENTTLDKDVILNPMRLKLGRIPYTIVDSDREDNPGNIPGIHVTEGEYLWLDWGFECKDDLDFEKKIYIKETSSVLPPQYVLYPITVWPYNQSWNYGSTSLHPHLNTGTGINLDFYKVTDRDQRDPCNREKPFQVLGFRMPPQTFTIKLVIAFRTSRINVNRDDLGIIDPNWDPIEFIPGDIIRVQFKLDNNHVLTPFTPDSGPSKYNISSSSRDYNEFISKLINLQQYDESGPTPKNERLFTFYLLDKKFKTPYPIKIPDVRLNTAFMIPDDRKTLLNTYNSGLLSLDVEKSIYKFREEARLGYYNLRRRLVVEDLISIYFTGQDKDIDLWLSPYLLKNIRIFTKTEGEQYFYRIEQSGYYGTFISGSRCGNGGDGGDGIDAGTRLVKTEITDTTPVDADGEPQRSLREGQFATMDKASAISLAGAGSDGMELQFGGQNYSEFHNAHVTGEGDDSHDVHNMSEIIPIPGGSLALYGTPGGDGGPGWTGGRGGNGGNGTQLSLGIHKDYLRLGLKIKLPIIGTVGFSTATPWKLPGLFFASGKAGSSSGSGGAGYLFPGVQGKPGTFSVIAGPSAGETGTIGSIFKATVFSLIENNIFLKKGTVLFSSVGRNGHNGIGGQVLYAIDENRKAIKEVREGSGDPFVGPDGGSGSPGTPTVLVSLTKNKEINIKNQNRTIIYVPGLEVTELQQDRESLTPRDHYTSMCEWAGGGLPIEQVAFFVVIFNKVHLWFSMIRIEFILLIDWKLIILYQCSFRFQACKWEKDPDNEFAPDKIKTYGKHRSSKIIRNGISTSYTSRTYTSWDNLFAEDTMFTSDAVWLVDNGFDESRGDEYTANPQRQRKYLITSSGKNPDEFILLNNLEKNVNFDAKMTSYDKEEDNVRALYYNGLQLGFDEPGIILYFQESIEKSSPPLSESEFNFKVA